MFPPSVLGSPGLFIAGWRTRFQEARTRHDRSYVAAGRLVTCGRQGRRGQIRWGLLSSDGGVLALREVEERLGVADRLASRLPGRPARAGPDHHILSDIIRSDY